MKSKLFIFSNEKINLQEGKFFCDNIDLKTTPEGLNKKFEVNLFGRKSNKKKSHEIKIKKTKIFTNILSYLSSVIDSTKLDSAKYLIISITPYTFLISIFLRLFGKKPIIYLRSDGYGEYKAIIGKIGPLVYHFMFNVSCSISNLISCREYILKGKKGKIISPSQLDSVWLRQPRITDIKNFKLLYVGRFKIEKGIFSLLNLIKNKKDISLTIVGAENSNLQNFNQSNVRIHQTQSSKVKLIKYYDDHNIFVLPSYTEGHPMVLLEALARRRPVVVFEDIKHVIGDKKGIFVSKRNFINFFGTLNNIKKNYKKIQKEMKKNKLPTNKEFIDKFIKYIDDFN
ncbi:glycosyltransferase [Candidatus Pelagibacter bacterium]|jgi:glycosyltransferase involved in cell wall biosynthesis|nr:glycosyltransferase [Candidatus Pelagibacter bacterium]